MNKRTRSKKGKNGKWKKVITKWMAAVAFMNKVMHERGFCSWIK
jgi:hypothetical protein